jgi:hypothetical protein
MGHPRLEMLEHAGLSSRHADRQRLARGRLEFNDVGTVILRPVTDVGK